MTNSSGDLPEDFLASLESLGEGTDSSELIRESFTSLNNTKHDARSIQQLLELVQTIEKLEKEGGMAKWFEGKYSIDTLPKHKAFFAATADYNEVLFLAGNRVGKTVAGAYALSCALTGIYPDWWPGRRFTEPVSAWAVGKDGRAVRDTLQKELLGGIGEWGTGMLPAHTLGKFFALQGTPQAIDIIKIRHISGGWSELGFKNYQQDIGSFMGTSKHIILGDEEIPLDIYNECNIRTATVDGLMLLTFTPLDGLTPLVVNFCKRADYLVGSKPIVAMDQDTDEDDAVDWQEATQVVGFKTSKAVIQAGWDDVPWLTPEVKARLLDDTPIHLREARSKGLPAMGSGNVYPVPLENILIDPIQIPDSWPRMYALDVGWNRTAALWGALDPATDTLYVYDEHYQGMEIPPIHAYAIQSRGKWVHGVIDPASRGRSQNDGNQILRNYKDLGLTLFLAQNSVESGVHNVMQRLVAGKLKVFKTCINFQKEYLLYRRDRHGRIVKENDHLQDCLKYLVNNMNRMSSKAEQKGLGQVNWTPKRYNI